MIRWCLEPHDLVLAKCVASRERDWESAREAVVHGIVDHAELLRRAPGLPIDAAQRDAIVRSLRTITS